MAITIATSDASNGSTDFTGLKAPRNLAIYNRMKGISDFGNLAQYELYEKGYPILVCLARPEYIVKLSKLNTSDANTRIPDWILSNTSQIKNMLNSFCDALEYEFRGIDGLPDITGETQEITDGINQMNMITKVTEDHSVQVTMQFFEKSGSLFTKFIEFYLGGIHDRGSEAKTYYGLINPFSPAGGTTLEPGYENEVFSFLYMVTDSSYMNLEKAYLLLNCQFTTANMDHYNVTKGDISFVELSIPMNCFPVHGRTVSQKATEMLKYLMTTGGNDGYNLMTDNFQYTGDKGNIYNNTTSDTNSYDLIANRLVNGTTSGATSDTAGGWRNNMG